MSPERMLRVAQDKALENEIAEYYWDHMEVHVDTRTPRERNMITYHVYLRFKVKVKWEELMYIIYH